MRGRHAFSLPEPAQEASERNSPLPADVRRAVRDDVRHELEGASGKGRPIEVDVEILFGSGRK